jgi:hypothetical protein
MINDRLVEIRDRELDEQRRALVYFMALVAAVLVIIVSVAIVVP